MDKIDTLYRSFVEDICKVFPEYRERLEYSDESDDKLQRLLRNLRKYIQPISDRDSSFFEKDPILLDNVSFKMMWNSDISISTKKSIWKYLQTLCVLMITMESEEKMKDVIQQIEDQQKVKDKKTVSEMKLLKKLNASIKEDTIKELGGMEGTGGIEDMGKLFENTSIGRIAKEITEDIDIEGMMGEGGGGIESLMNPAMMSKLFQSISTKMSDNEGEMNSDKLMSEATSICQTMKGNPMFESIMGMQNSLLGEQQPTSKDTSHNSNKTRDRLRKKLEKQQDIDVD